MTLETTLTRILYTGDGHSRSFPLPFPVLAESHVQATHTDAKGVDTVLHANYRVEHIQTEAQVVYPAAEGQPPLQPGESLTLMRVLPLIQQTDLENGGILEAETIERQFDVITMQLQQLAEELKRTLKFPVSSVIESPLVTDVYAEMAELVKRAEDAAVRAELVADTQTLGDGLENRRITWKGAAIAVGEELSLPVHYYRGRNVLLLSMNGVLCYPHDPLAPVSSYQYEEVGEPETLSNTVRLCFTAEKDAVWNAWVVASNVSHEFDRQVARAEEAMTKAEEAMARAEAAASVLENAVENLAGTKGL